MTKKNSHIFAWKNQIIWEICLEKSESFFPRTQDPQISNETDITKSGFLK